MKSAYANSYRQSAVQTASPGQLILMLFDGALRFMTRAVQGFDETDLVQRNETIHINLMKTQAIITELQASLNCEVGGEFARTMSDLYDFMRAQLYQANIGKKPEPVKTVMGLLGDIREAWATMLSQTETQAAVPTNWAATAA